MKLSFWDILASMVMLAGLALATIFINIFINPYTFINPFPPPTPVAALNVPTLTPSPRSLPELWTGTPETPGAQLTELALNSATPSATVTITGTPLILPTGTPTRTITKTRTSTPNKSLTAAIVKTATKTSSSSSSDTTKPTTPGKPTTSSSTNDATPTYTWTASTDANGIDYYEIYWNTDNSCEGTLYTGTSSATWTKSVLSSQDTYYVCVRAVDDAGNKSNWSSVSNAWTFVDTTNPTVPGTPSTTSLVTDATPTFTWTVSTDSGSGIFGYEIYWGTDGTCGSAPTTRTVANFTPPALTTNGTWYICVRARDRVGNLSAFSGPTAFAYSGNVAPVITSNGGGATASISVAENSTAVTNVNATDVNGGTLTYSISGGADAARFAIVASSGIITFSPAPNFEIPTDAGGDNIYNVTVQVADPGGLTVTQALTVTVTNINEAPTDIALSSSNVDENMPPNTVVGALTTSDVDSGNTFTYTLVSGSGSTNNASFNISGANLQTSASFDVETKNSYSIRVRSTDQNGLTFTKIFIITVNDVNESTPVITSYGGAASVNLSINENITAVADVNASDGDPGASLTYSIVVVDDAALFSINTSNGVLTFTSAPDFESPTDIGADNIYNVTVMVSDGSNSDNQAFIITINNVNEFSPVITSDGGGASAGLSIAENTTAVTTVAATDGDSGATLTFSISGTDAADFSINSGSGEITFNSAPDFENPSDNGANNTYVLNAVVSDGTNNDSQTITVTVTDDNEFSPVFTSGTSFSTQENTTGVTTVTATDGDGDATLTYSKTGGADSGLFNLDSSSGVLTFLVAPDWDVPGDSGGNNVYNINIEVSDGSNSDSQSIVVTVTDEGD